MLVRVYHCKPMIQKIANGVPIIQRSDSAMEAGPMTIACISMVDLS
jgi:hypothetical protein